MNIRYVMLTTDSGNNEDYNIFYCPIYRVTGNGDFSEPVFEKTNYTTDVWVDTVEALGYEVEAVDLSYVIQEDEEEEVELDDGQVEVMKTSISDMLKSLGHSGEVDWG